MKKEEIIIKLKEIFQMIAHSGVDVDKISEDANIMRDLGVNSVGMIYMAVAIEKVFNISLGNASINSFQTVNDVITFIEKETNK